MFFSRVRRETLALPEPGEGLFWRVRVVGFASELVQVQLRRNGVFSRLVAEATVPVVFLFGSGQVDEGATMKAIKSAAAGLLTSTTTVGGAG